MSGSGRVDRDQAARGFAVDPSRKVVLEASAGTGKTSVLVTRYVNLLRAGVDPRNILAITFTRKAAAEMRQRIVIELRRAASLSTADAARWHELRDRLGDISISTIDAFCLSLLREFPLEAGLQPGFDIADETLVRSLKNRALEDTVRVCRRVALKDESVRLLVSELGDRRLRATLEGLLDRRLVARSALRTNGRRARRSADEACAATSSAVAELFDLLPGGLEGFIDSGPRLHPGFELVSSDLRELIRANRAADHAVQGLFKASLDGAASYLLTRRGEPRQRLAPEYSQRDFLSVDDQRRHVRALKTIAPQFGRLRRAYQRDVGDIVLRGLRRALEIAVFRFLRALQSTGVLDFSEVLARTLTMLARMDEFSQSRYRLEARYHHVLVDEFQDTSRAQWRLVSLLVRSWGEGAGVSHESGLAPSIFIVGDRKQSIYSFRDADPTMVSLARRDIEALRPGSRVRRSISRSFRSVPELLSFANDLFSNLDSGSGRGRFRFSARDRFPVQAADADARVGLIAAETLDGCAHAVAAEIGRLLEAGTIVRDARGGPSREIRPGDIAILFRSRQGHQEYERALAARNVPSYVYKGLGFFDADETKDLRVLVDFLSHPTSNLAAAAFLRSRFVGLSDRALQAFAPDIAACIAGGAAERQCTLAAQDESLLDLARRSVATWLPLVDRLTPSELLDRVLADSAYACEIRGPRRAQASENMKKMRALVRRIENRGYATLGDVAAHLETLSLGDESNAVIDALDAVNLMTVHAAKGLEFPVVFIVNLGRGTGGDRESVRISTEGGKAKVSIGDPDEEQADEAAVRDREETKRLLYVAVTRARDHLYFASQVKDGRMSAARGSLAAVLPPSFAQLFATAPGNPKDDLEWNGHRIKKMEAAEESTDRPLAGVGTEATYHDAFGPVPTSGIVRKAVTSFVDAGAAQAEPAPAPTHDEDQPVLGLLVHRLMQTLAPGPSLPVRETLVARANALMTEATPLKPQGAASERSRLQPGGDVAERAADMLISVLSRPEIQPLLGAVRWVTEVPFSLCDFSYTGSRIVLRGVIDLIVENETEITVVELKTGGAREQHQAQLDVYVKAASASYPGRSVSGLLVYA